MCNITNIVKSYEDLVTNPEQTRAGFVEYALEKSRYSTPLIRDARSLKILASEAKEPNDLINLRDIWPSLLTAAGLSDKSLNYLTEEDKKKAIKNLIDNYLKPAGAHFIEELVYRFLIVKGDAMGGKMRNIIGIIAQQKMINALLANLSVMQISYRLYTGTSKCWSDPTCGEQFIDPSLKGIFWRYNNKDRILAFNLKIPLVKKNVDICLFDANTNTYEDGLIVNKINKIIMLGELKGGIDPAGADEHWKTGNSALERIRRSFNAKGIVMKTAFIAAAIQKSMAEEIYSQLMGGVLSYAANLTIDVQLINFCDWIIRL